jgi:SAM-dependent methyltransferase
MRNRALPMGRQAAPRLPLRALPHFTEHGENQKRKPLDDTRYGEPERVILEFLTEACRGRARDELRILDLGCGRGSRVAWLCSHGWNAWGADIVEDYLRAGRPFFELNGWDPNRLRLIDGPRLPFDRSAFDVVVSDQVIEHVADLEEFVAGIDQVSRAGAHGLHVFPASRRLVEPHLRMPFVHWLPKGPVRRLAIRHAMRLGLSVKHFADFSARERAVIYTIFSEEETYYRTRRKVAAAFAGRGMSVDLRSVARNKVAVRLPHLPAVLTPIAAQGYSLLLQTYVQTRKD